MSVARSACGEPSYADMKRLSERFGRHVERPAAKKPALHNAAPALSKATFMSVPLVRPRLEHHESPWLWASQLAPAHCHRRREHNLTFAHIPKTAGSTIERLSHRLGFNPGWGYMNKRIRKESGGHAAGVESCPKWHVPPSRRPGDYSGTDVFCIVRHPVDRIVSEFKYRYKENERKTRPGNCTAQRMNEWAVRRFLPSAKGGKHGCHGLPQVDYLRRRISSFVNPERRLSSKAPGSSVKPLGFSAGCTVVLKMETLADDFASLTQCYNLLDQADPAKVALLRRANQTDREIVELPRANPSDSPERQNRGQAASPATCHLNVSHLTSATIRAIESFYASDMAAFGYAPARRRLPSPGSPPAPERTRRLGAVISRV